MARLHRIERQRDGAGSCIYYYIIGATIALVILHLIFN
jgi:hypothetical protein